MSYARSEREPQLRRVVKYVGAVVALSLAVLLVLDILDRGETTAGDIVFWVWFISTVTLLLLGLGILLTRSAVRLGGLANGPGPACLGPLGARHGHHSLVVEAVGDCRGLPGTARRFDIANPS